MDERELATVAHSYYVVGETMEAIAKRVGVSRSTVSRMLADARERGIVRITIDTPSHDSAGLDRHLAHLGVSAHVVDVREGASPLARLDAVARTAGHLVSSLMGDGDSLGIAWGTTTTAVVDRLPAKPLRDATVVQLNGAASSWTSGIAYAGDLLTRAAAAYDAHAQHFPTPAFFDAPEAKRLLWHEASVRRVLDMHRKLSVALFGVGSLSAELPSHVYTAHYLSPADLAELEAENVVGDVCTVFVREDGTYADIALNDRSSGPTPGLLRSLPRRICVVVGAAKVPALVGVLRSRAVTDLVVDRTTALALVRHLEHRPPLAVRLPG
ncbi:sugar-binding transcriptional regulator [Mobilicoccus pelagius]|uniref:Putative deoxyribonucleoside regulator n=1 Tax=Mobilicoccus pelagius NBRC 104925 TaxID=1089455 RepID=H5UUQ5_9MICO|nr:sugar-binding domain-containing protein [Mobilicoccus pelagius]GAB49463.1 putative deoxyribonucleoside regulator [Mobilicoccus pelagius NBRC 104925]